MSRRALAGLVDTAGAGATAWALHATGLLPLLRWYVPAEGFLPLESVGIALRSAPWAAYADMARLAVALVAWHAAPALLGGVSPGAWAMRLRAVDADGDAAGPVRLLARAAVYAALPLSLGLMAGLPWISRTQRGLPDLVARTWLVTRGISGIPTKM